MGYIQRDREREIIDAVSVIPQLQKKKNALNTSFKTYASTCFYHFYQLPQSANKRRAGDHYGYL